MKELRKYNFSAGPSVMPEEVLRKAASEMLDYKGSGMSVMEMSHRGPVFKEIFDETKAKLKSLYNVPDDYEILFLQGGATSQFAAIPMNLIEGGKADYAVTGTTIRSTARSGSIFRMLIRSLSAIFLRVLFQSRWISPNSDFYMLERRKIWLRRG